MLSRSFLGALLLASFIALIIMAHKYDDTTMYVFSYVGLFSLLAYNFVHNRMYSQFMAVKHDHKKISEEADVLQTIVVRFDKIANGPSQNGSELLQKILKDQNMSHILDKQYY